MLGILMMVVNTVYYNFRRLMSFSLFTMLRPLIFYVLFIICICTENWLIDGWMDVSW